MLGERDALSIGPAQAGDRVALGKEDEMYIGIGALLLIIIIIILVT